jgi:hypothetical protein
MLSSVTEFFILVHAVASWKSIISALELAIRSMEVMYVISNCAEVLYMENPCPLIYVLIDDYEMLNPSLFYLIGGNFAQFNQYYSYLKLVNIFRSYFIYYINIYMLYSTGVNFAALRV